MYTFLRLEKESSTENGAARNIWVALIKATDVEQPFRVHVENFETEEEVMQQVNAWINARNEEDAAALIERERIAKEALEDGIASRLNTSL